MIATRNVGPPPGSRFYCRRNQHLVTAGLLVTLVSGMGLFWAACWRLSGRPEVERRLGGRVERALPQRVQAPSESLTGAKRAR